MKDYILNSNIISTTEERYLRLFKDMGYLPYVKKEKSKPISKNEKKEEPKKEVK